MVATAEKSMPAYAARHNAREDGGIDLLRVPLLGQLLRWRGVRLALQLPLFVFAAILVMHGLFGPDLAPKNLSTLVTWVHYRGILVLGLLLAGNLFCLACPFLVMRDFSRRLFRPLWSWPRILRNKWLSIALLVLILFIYEWFALWSAPMWTALLIIAFFAGALVVDSLFKHGSFCKWVCPIGQFNFVASTMSPLEVRVRDHEVCSNCATKDCIRGRIEPTANERNGRQSLPVVSQRGCELALFQPMKVGNLDCTFCLDCVHACPHDNIGVMSRLPGAELWSESRRSGVGWLLMRTDMAALIVAFTFGALLNAFGMVSPVYAVQAWLSQVLGTTNRAPILGVLFIAGLVIEPVLLLGLAAWATRKLTATYMGLIPIATRYCVSLIPLGFGIWLAHYAFHFLTGILTIVPVTQNALLELGWPLLGEPNWQLSGMREGQVFVLEMGFLALGLVGSWVVAVRLARQQHAMAPWRAFAPWVVLHVLLWSSAVWLLMQPMEMRGTFLGG